MSEWSGHNSPPGDTPSKARDTLIVKVKQTSATAASIIVKGQLMQAINDAAKAKRLTVAQWIRETIENALIREGKLPSWWHNRQFKD